MHECWQREQKDVRHSSAEALAASLPAHLFDRILLIHHNPGWSEEERTGVRALAETFGASLATDGLCVELP